MSTLGTFAKYSGQANFGILQDIEQARQRMEPGYADKVVAKNKAAQKAANPMIQGESPDRVQKGRYQGRRARIANKGSNVINRPSAEAKAIMPAMKVTKQSEASKKRVADSMAEIAKKKGLKIRNLGLGIGLGTAGLAGLGAAAYLNRDSNRRANMSAKSAFANFAETTRKIGKGDKAVEYTMDELANIKKSSKATQAQKAVERSIDRGDDIYKGAKGMDYVTRTGALLGSPERGLITSGKKSKNELVRNIAKGAEKFGSLGYKQGATGARGVLNKVAGRTVTGKAVRLGAAGIGLSAIGGAMKRNRQENQ